MESPLVNRTVGRILLCELVGATVMKGTRVSVSPGVGNE